MKNKFKPAVHFTPPKGWGNDPNGMFYANGKYHFFYQHRPNSCTFPRNRSEYKMHWGHAVSSDLLRWENLPIALFPDEKGDCWSGSCVVDKENLSGLGKNAVLAYYTNYVAEDGTQEQGLAYSSDYENFIKFPKNPVVPNPGQSDFRDPKVFWNPVKNCYSMALTGGKHIEFYASDDLLNWEKTGEFEAAKFGLDGICECPDCFPVKTYEGEKWVLITSVKTPKEEARQRCDAFDRVAFLVEYFVGDFDGDKFINTEKSDKPLLLDYGTDFYGAVTFEGAEDKIAMGWASNWEFARDFPTEDEGYRGAYTLPRKLELVKTDKGYRIASSFVGLDNYKTEPLESGENVLSAETFGLRLKVSGEGSIKLSNENGEQIVILAEKDKFIVDTTRAGLKAFSEIYSLDCIRKSSAEVLSETPWDMEIVFDKSILEVIGDGGLAPITATVYPTLPYDKITISGDITAEFYEIK